MAVIVFLTFVYTCVHCQSVALHRTVDTNWQRSVLLTGVAVLPHWCVLEYVMVNVGQQCQGGRSKPSVTDTEVDKGLSRNAGR